MLTTIRRYVRSAISAVRANKELLSCNLAALTHLKYISVSAVEQFYSNLNLPSDKIPHCRFITKTRLLDLYEKNIIFRETTDNGCIFQNLEQNIQLLVPFEGFDEYVGLCWDVYIQGYRLDVDKPFIVVDIGSNLFNAALAFAHNPLCKQVFCYEIIPAIYDIGQMNLDLNPRLRSKIKGFGFGLYNRSADIDVSYYPLRAGASGISEKLREEEWLAKTTDQDFIGTGNRQQFRAPVMEAYPVIKGVREAFPDDELVIKIDAENSEYEILENLLPLFDNIYCFFVELHSRSTADRIVALFKDTNYISTGTAVRAFYNRCRINGKHLCA